MLPDPTDRLRFRELVPGDADALGTVPVPRAPSAWVEWNQQNYVQHGFGLWAVETLDGTFVGDCGLTLQEVSGEWLVEIGWHTLPGLRGRGYAPEAATSVLATARTSGIGHVVAIIRPDNVASQGVARKIGLVLEREVEKNGGPALVFGTDL